MKASELVARIQELIAANGDVNVFHFQGDMKTLNADCFDVVDTMTDDPTEREQYGEKYLFIDMMQAA